MSRITPTSMDVDDSTIVVVPLGSWEQHGPHLPLDTDSVIVDAVVTAALTRTESPSSFLVAPTIAITASDEHGGFTGGLSMGSDATREALVSIARSASWSRGICFVNGHGGNFDALRGAASALAHEGITHSSWSLPNYDGADMHAGHTETSLMLHISPALVRLDRIETGTVGDRATMIEAMRREGVGSVSPNGILGDPTTASAAHGAEVLEMYARSLAAHLDALWLEWRPA